jgi:hypothetical protein
MAFTCRLSAISPRFSLNETSVPANKARPETVYNFRGCIFAIKRNYRSPRPLDAIIIRQRGFLSRRVQRRKEIDEAFFRALLNLRAELRHT